MRIRTKVKGQLGNVLRVYVVACPSHDNVINLFLLECIFQVTRSYLPPQCTRKNLFLNYCTTVPYVRKGAPHLGGCLSWMARVGCHCCAVGLSSGGAAPRCLRHQWPWFSLSSFVLLVCRLGWCSSNRDSLIPNISLWCDAFGPC